MSKEEERPKLTPEEWILAFMYAGGNNPIHGKLMLVKQFFLLAKEHLPSLDETFKFFPFNYGPYSTILAQKINEMIKEGLIEMRTLNEGNEEKYEFSLTIEGRNEAERIYNILPDEIKKKMDKLRKGSTQLGYTGIVRYVYSKYPEYAIVSRIRGSAENDL